MAESIKLLLGPDGYVLQVGGVNSDPADYGDMAEVECKGKTYMATADVEGGDNKEVSYWVREVSGDLEPDVEEVEDLPGDEDDEDEGDDDDDDEAIGIGTGGGDVEELHT